MAESAEEQLVFAEGHLERVQAAWDQPTDWTELTLFGFYCLEAAVVAAAKHFGLRGSKSHSQKVEIAGILHANHGLPDLSTLLPDLNRARKAAAYGDVEMPDLDAEDLANQVEAYVDAVRSVVRQ